MTENKKKLGKNDLKVINEIFKNNENAQEFITMYEGARAESEDNVLACMVGLIKYPEDKECFKKYFYKDKESHKNRFKKPKKKLNFSS